MVGVIFHSNYAYFNVMMSDGNHGTLDYTKKQEIKMTKQEPVANSRSALKSAHLFILLFQLHSIHFTH